MSQGECPKCGSTDLDYGSREGGVGGDTFYYPFTCKTCKFEGKEWYEANFTGFTDDDGNDIEKNKEVI